LVEAEEGDCGDDYEGNYPYPEALKLEMNVIYYKVFFAPCIESFPEYVKDHIQEILRGDEGRR
jgi:hypothetical protein